VCGDALLVGAWVVGVPVLVEVLVVVVVAVAKVGALVLMEGLET
jgi:hypothetical protein